MLYLQHGGRDDRQPGSDAAKKGDSGVRSRGGAGGGARTDAAGGLRGALELQFPALPAGVDRIAGEAKAGRGAVHVAIGRANGFGAGGGRGGPWSMEDDDRGAVTVDVREWIRGKQNPGVREEGKICEVVLSARVVQ